MNVSAEPVAPVDMATDDVVTKSPEKIASPKIIPTTASGRPYFAAPKDPSELDVSAFQSFPKTPAPAAMLKDIHVLRHLFMKNAGFYDEQIKQLSELFQRTCKSNSKVYFNAEVRMTFEVFRDFIIQFGFPEDESAAAFHAFCRPMGGQASRGSIPEIDAGQLQLCEEDFIVGMAVLDPFTPHEGLPGIVRLAYIFSGYDLDCDGIFDPSDLLRLIRRIRLEKGQSTDPEKVLENAEQVTSDFGFSSETAITKSDFVRLVLDEHLEGVDLVFRLKKSPVRTSFHPPTSSVAPGKLPNSFTSSSSATTTSPSGETKAAAFRKRRRSFKSSRFYDDDLHILNLDVHDLGAGNVPAKRINIADFATPRSATQSLLGALSVDTTAAAADQEAPKVINFLLNPFNESNFCTWVDADASPVVAMAESGPTLVQDTSRRRKVLQIPQINRPNFAGAVKYLSDKCKKIFREESKLLRLQSPMYVFGDIHGNMQDLAWLGQNMWPMTPLHTAGKMLFLGDYVDRGPNSVEVVAYLFALKLMAPKKVFLLRGNHEHRGMNGRKSSDTLVVQCMQLFGKREGISVWDAINSAFDCLPLACLIDDHLLAVHGGIPRAYDFLVTPTTPETHTSAAPASKAEDINATPTQDSSIPVTALRPPSPTASAQNHTDNSHPSFHDSSRLSEPLSDPMKDDETDENATDKAAEKQKGALHRVEDVLKAVEELPSTLKSQVTGLFDCNNADPFQQQLARDLMWGDPATQEQLALLDDDGFLAEQDPRVAEASRGGDLRPRYLAFGPSAVDRIYQQYRITHILRGHSVKATGLGLQHGARVITIFSDSMDHHVRGRCGWVLIEDREDSPHKVHLHVGGPNSGAVPNT